MFLDASVIVAVLGGEAEAPAILAALAEAAMLGTSAIAVFEASTRLSRLLRVPIDQAHDAVMAFVAGVGADLLPIAAGTSRAAHDCAARYHHLTGHPARLNMGDCFAYAAAKEAGLKLAYKGDDFPQTDVEGIRFGA